MKLSITETLVEIQAVVIRVRYKQAYRKAPEKQRLIVADCSVQDSRLRQIKDTFIIEKRYEKSFLSKATSVFKRVNYNQRQNVEALS